MPSAASEMTSPRVSLVMCTYGRTDCIYRLIESKLEAQTQGDFELIIVDQNLPGALDAIVAKAREKLSVQYLRSAPGLSRARNVGLKHCRGAIVAFPDDDCWYPPNLIEQVTALFGARPDTAIITYVIPSTFDADGQESNGKFLPASQDVNRSNVWYCGNSNGIFVRHDVIRQIGGFNETLGVGSGTRFGAGEETDFLLRALAANAKITYLHELHTHHPQVNTVLDAQALKRARLYAQGFGRTLKLNQYPWYYALYRAARSLVAALLSALRGDMLAAKFKWIWVRGTLAGYMSSASPVRQTRANTGKSCFCAFFAKNR